MGNPSSSGGESNESLSEGEAPEPCEWEDWNVEQDENDQMVRELSVNRQRSHLRRVSPGANSGMGMYHTAHAVPVLGRDLGLASRDAGGVCARVWVRPACVAQGARHGLLRRYSSDQLRAQVSACPQRPNRPLSWVPPHIRQPLLGPACTLNHVDRSGERRGMSLRAFSQVFRSLNRTMRFKARSSTLSRQPRRWRLAAVCIAARASARTPQCFRT